MLISPTYRATVKGSPVRIVVVRNDGYAWGVAQASNGHQYDINGARDVYDDDDESAARYFVRVARRNGLTEPAIRPVTFGTPADL